jgi:hypothetical protein
VFDGLGIEWRLDLHAKPTDVSCLCHKGHKLPVPLHSSNALYASAHPKQTDDRSVCSTSPPDSPSFRCMMALRRQAW